MLYREIIAVCSEIHTKHINTLCGQNVVFVNVKLVVPIVTTGRQWINLLENVNRRRLADSVTSRKVMLVLGELSLIWN